mgnify:CR=1 FL=1
MADFGKLVEAWDPILRKAFPVNRMPFLTEQLLKSQLLVLIQVIDIDPVHAH